MFPIQPKLELRRRVYDLHVHQGMSFSDIAKELGITRSAVGGFVHRERKLVARRLLELEQALKEPPQLEDLVDKITPENRHEEF